MRVFVLWVRRFGVALACVASAAASIALAWGVMSRPPESTSLAALVLIAGLALFPMLTVIAMAMHREGRAAADQP